MMRSLTLSLFVVVLGSLWTLAASAAPLPPTPPGRVTPAQPVPPRFDVVVVEVPLGAAFDPTRLPREIAAVKPGPSGATATPVPLASAVSGMLAAGDPVVLTHYLLASADRGGATPPEVRMASPVLVHVALAANHATFDVLPIGRLPLSVAGGLHALGRPTNAGPVPVGVPPTPPSATGTQSVRIEVPTPLEGTEVVELPSPGIAHLYVLISQR